VESKAAPVAPAAPAVVKVDDVRGAAIAFIGKHSKERFTEILKGYGATNISTVPPEKLAHLLATLTAGL